MSAKSSRRSIIRSINGNRYALTSRRIVELDSQDAKEGAPWYAMNIDIRTAAEQLSETNVYDYVTVKARTSEDNPTIVTVVVRIGQTSDGRYQIGCADFDLKTFKRILKNAGVKTVAKIAKAFAAKAGV